MHELSGFWHYFFLPVGQPWYTGNVWGNQLQWTIVWLPSLYVIYIHKFKCTACWRPAYHPVKGTHFKTCHKHTTIAMHAKLSRDHKIKYPKEHQLLNKGVK
jgi:hypothetical protein